jgi:hypothetical protein
MVILALDVAPPAAVPPPIATVVALAPELTTLFPTRNDDVTEVEACEKSFVAETGPVSEIEPGPSVTAPVVDFVCPMEPEKSTSPVPVAVIEELNVAGPAVVVAPSPRTCGQCAAGYMPRMRCGSANTRTVNMAVPPESSSCRKNPLPGASSA